MITLINNANKFKERIAIKNERKSYTYNDLLNTSKNVALNLFSGKKDLEEDRVAFIVSPGFQYVSIQWGIWRAGGIAVPLCIKHPFLSIKYTIEDSNASIIVFSKEFKSLIDPLRSNKSVRFIQSDKLKKRNGTLPLVDLSRRAMILYTSGTTGLPKGVVTTHQNIQAQIIPLIKSWGWNNNDHILNVLPLHHIHGIINVLSCALWSGACCQFLPKFDPKKIFQIFIKKEVNVFMAVPTIYYKLISYWELLPEDQKKKLLIVLKNFRLMVSGSAALPISVMEKWKEISEHTLLERYGMTEIGMGISNPYHGERKPGYIGQPLLDVSIRLVDEKNKIVPSESPGEIQIKGPNVFVEYWNKPKETIDAFTKDGWFKSGDIAICKENSYKILGRNSVDIIKSGGYKISALEIEEVLRQHPKIKDCAVVGVPNIEWGEIIAVSLTLKEDTISVDNLKDWLRERLPGYKIPRKYMIQDDLPRNVMGKVTKKELKKIFETENNIRK